MSAGEKYVAATYGVFVLFVLVWVAIISATVARLEREAAALAKLSQDRADG